jgi:hypothetical protein
VCFVQRSAEHIFISSVLSTDEAPFARDGIINIRNEYQWAEENPHGDCSVSLHVFPHQLTGNHYRDFLLRELPKLLENVPLAVKARIWYMHDGALAYFSCAVRDVFNNTYYNQLIDREGPTA